MKQTRWKLFFDYEKEEVWINAMAAKGLALTDYFMGRYTFAESQPGEYVYRLELLENSHSHPESQHYLRFLEESGVELMTTWHRWVYLRKGNADSGFEIYSDIQSRLRHYQRIGLLYWVIAISQLCFVYPRLVSIFSHFQPEGSRLPVFDVAILALHLVLGLGLGSIYLAYRKKIKSLKRESTIRQ